MAMEPKINGDASSASGSGSGSVNLSLAERLQQKHGDESHRPTIEDAVDEEDVIHPPPSAKHTHKEPTAVSEPLLAPVSEPISVKSAGKQKAQDTPVSVPSSNPIGKGASIDTTSEELFPALGGGPKANTPSQVPTAWNARKPPSVTNVAPNGVNGHGPVRSAASSRPSTPASGILTPSSPNVPVSSQTRGSLPSMTMPGKHSERVAFAPSQLLPRAQLKKPVQETLRDINKRSKATVEMRPGPGGVIYFEGKGPVDAVRQALKDVAKEVGSKQAVKVPIPTSVRPHVIGRQGTTIQAISKRTGARIQVPKSEETVSGGADDDDSKTIDVSIEGDAVAAEMARREIESIVNERTSTVNMRLRDVPAEFYPFIAGPHNAGINALERDRDIKVNIPQYHTWSHRPPPQAPSTGPVEFTPHPSSHIQLSGDRLAVQEARSEIERQVSELRKQLTLTQLAIDRDQHQFVIGDKSGSLHDLLEETGCAVIVPPESDDTEMLTVTGPQDRLELGMDKIMNLATSMQMSSVDIARQHASAPMGPQVHARALTRYLQRRQAIEQLEQLFDSRIVIPAAADTPMIWKVYSKDGKNTIRARSEIINLVNAHPPSRMKHVDMDPFFHQYIQEQAARRIRDDHGVHLLIPDEIEHSPQVVLICEGPASQTPDFELPKQRPSQAETAGFERALQEAEAQILGLMTGQEEIVERIVEAPPKFHNKVRSHVQLLQQSLPPSTIPVQLGSRDQNILLRGPSQHVIGLAEAIVAFIEDEKRDELERGFTTSFDFPQKYANYLIGKKGENINNLREKFDVDIQVNNGKVEVKGPQAKAEKAKIEIITLGKKLEDEATHVLKIQPQYHREMIGAKGSQVNRLQDRYNVRVQFPRSAPVQHDNESITDTNSEVGTHRGHRTNQAPDEVIIRGPKKGADEARDELLSLLQYTVDTGHSTTVSVAQGQLPSLIGQGGKEMESVREFTGARIDVPGNRDTPDSSGRVEIKIRGTRKQVDDAKKLLEQRAKTFDESISRSLDVDKKYHRALIGGGGANIRNIVINAGGPDDRRELARTVRFPRQDSEENAIRVEGRKAIVDKIVASIQAFVDQRENEVTEAMEVAPEKHRILIGQGGETRRGLESKFSVSVDIPKLNAQGSARSQIKLAGQPENVQKAKEHILGLVKEQEGETLQVPRSMHHAISDNGQFFRRLRTDHRVTVDHAGQQPPSQRATQSRTRENGNVPLPLITDEAESIDNHSWEVVENDANSFGEGNIPWILRGSPENVAKARAAVQKALDHAQSHTATGYLILPDPKTYRYVIGQGGSQINSIRKQTGCKITVPKDQAKGEAIEILGGKDGVEQAKDIILEVVKNGSSGSRRD